VAHACLEPCTRTVKTVQSSRVFDAVLDVDLTVRDRVKGMLGKGYVFGCHFLPHDAAARQYSGQTFAADLEDAGLLHTRIVPRTDDEWTGINHMRQEMLPRISFRLPECETGVSRLEAYHTARETSGGLARNVPVHDINSHAAAALRTIGEADMAGLIPGSGTSGSGRLGGNMFSKAGLPALKGSDEALGELPLRRAWRYALTAGEARGPSPP